MYKISDDKLPTSGVQVAQYRSQGKEMRLVLPSAAVSTARANLVFTTLEARGGEMGFDPASLSATEVIGAKKPGKGRLLGLIALPFSVVVESFNTTDSRVLVTVDGKAYAGYPLHNKTAAKPEDDVVLGLYAGNPDISGLKPEGSLPDRDRSGEVQEALKPRGNQRS